MEKLVRDLIPQRMLEAGAEPVFRVAETSERVGLLLAKLQEEVAEAIEAPCKEELADVLEVLVTLAEALGISPAELEQARREKMEWAGAFRQGFVLQV